MIDKIIAFESGELSFSETIDLFAELIKTGQAWTLQGNYGRNAQSLIEQGFISSAGQVLHNNISKEY